MHIFDPQYFEETSLHSFTAEISELEHAKQLEGCKGLPSCFFLPGIGNGLSFTVIHVDRSDDDGLRFVKYAQTAGCVTVTIFND